MSLDAVIAMLRERSGLDPGALGPNAIETAVAARQRAIGIEDSWNYAARLASDSNEFQALTEDLSVPETWFFRGGMDLFAHLAGVVRNAARSPARPFRILSAPCSTGEEPYSLAIALAEACVPPSAWNLEGVDLSGRALDQARVGGYREFSFRQTDPAIRNRYFRLVDGRWEIEPAIRERLQLHQGNMIEPAVLAGEPPYDLIFCRNLLIYLHATARAQLLANLDRLLAPEGFLCAGHAEPLQLLDARFQLVPPERFMLFRRATAQEKSKRGEDFPRVPARASTVPLPSRTSEDSSPSDTRKPAKLRPALQPRDELPALDELAHARSLADAGRIGDALAACTAHIEREGPSANAFALLGILRQSGHEEDEAARCFEKALYLEPQHHEALTHLMLLYQQRGDAGRAALLRRRLELVRAGGEA